MNRDLFINVMSWSDSRVSYYASARTDPGAPEGIPEQEPDLSPDELRRAISALDTAREKFLQLWHKHCEQVHQAVKKEIKDMTENEKT